jgi:hypothetical protein
MIDLSLHLVPMSLSMDLQQIHRRYSKNTFNTPDGDQYIFNVRIENGDSFDREPLALSFNEAPVNYLSDYFNGRAGELARIGEGLDVDHGDSPARCIIHGKRGIGKTQLALQYAKFSFDQQRYSLIFWISGTTIENLNDGFDDLLHLVDHPDRSRPLEPRAKLNAARRWLEDSSPLEWLLVLDDVDRGTLDYVQEHLPCKNMRGNILFTTRIESIAQALASAGGQRHEIIELGPPEVVDAVNLLLAEIDTDATSQSSLAIQKAESVVHSLGRLPLAIYNAASFMRQTHMNLDEMQRLLQSEHRTQVRSHATCASPTVSHSDR